MIRVMLVDDHPIVRRGVRALLETQRDIQVVAEAESGEGALEALGTVTVDVVLLDILMPGMGGVETARRLQTTFPSVRVLALTSADDPARVLDMIRAGARGYLLKDVDAGHLVETVRRVAAGEIVLEERVSALMARSLQQPVAAGPAGPHLSDREIEVLRWVAQGLTNAEIAHRLNLSDKTVKTHVSNILAKLGVLDRTQAAVYAWKVGLISEP